MAANVFHVEFGLNETALTRALESERYDLAEKLIRDTTSASYLDEGTVDMLAFDEVSRTPSVIVDTFYPFMVKLILKIDVIVDFVC